ncbi:MAG: thiamine phosphate synthase [Dehalococcoidia bacterium]
MVLINAPIFSLVTNRSRVKNEDFISVIEEVVAGGVNLVQIREKDLSIDELQNIYCKLADRINRNSLISVNVSKFTNKFGHGCLLHFPEDVKLDPQIRKSKFGQSVHSVQSAVTAEKAGASYLFAGTIFPSKSHPGLPGAGTEYLASICRAVTIPTVAIGGIDETNTESVMKSGAAGVAVISSLLEAKDPYKKALEISHIIETAWENNRLGI